VKKKPKPSEVKLLCVNDSQNKLVNALVSIREAGGQLLGSKKVNLTLASEICLYKKGLIRSYTLRNGRTVLLRAAVGRGDHILYTIGDERMSPGLAVLQGLDPHAQAVTFA